ncbi:MAG: metallophosphoesterase [Candidatus Aenigmatarchaeota archaeon]
MKYKITYKTPENKIEETCYRYVKTPFCKLKDGPIKIIIFSDTHFPDDRGFKKEELKEPELFDLRTNCEYVNKVFLRKLVNNPNYYPSGDEKFLMNGFNIASAMWYVVKNEAPDFLIILGDDHGGFGHTWEDLGLPSQHKASDMDKEMITRMFRLGQRKIYSAIMSHIPCYYVLGNHDGENGWLGTKEYAKNWRKKYLSLPNFEHGDSYDENYYKIIWGIDSDNFLNFFEKSPEVLCLVLDCTGYNTTQPKKPEDWTLGNDQLKWLKENVKKDSNFKLVLSHHILGGWPTESDCKLDGEHKYAYGRGMGFTSEYYEDINRFLEVNGFRHLKVDPQKIEMVSITELFKECGIDAIIYGHDHIFKGKKVGICKNGKEIHAVCAGSTKYYAEKNWFKQPLFIKDYGNYEKRDFFTCPGYLAIEIKNGIDFYYKSASPTSFNSTTNLPRTAKVGDVISMYSI